MTDVPQLIQSDFNTKKALLCGLLASASCVLVALHEPISAPTPSTPAPTDLTSKWVLDYSFAGIKGDLSSFSLAEHGTVCLIDRSGGELVGSGEDQFGEGPEQFQITGKFDGDRVTLSKIYLCDSGEDAVVKPISLQGRLVRESGKPVAMEGIWSKKILSGHFLNHHVVTYRGEFRAHMINGDTVEKSSQSELSPRNNGQLPGTTL